MPIPIVVLDACVLYPAPLRDLLLWLALSGLYRPRWTVMIHEEWMRSLLKERPDLARDRLERTRDLMDKAVPDCIVAGYEGLIVAGAARPPPKVRRGLICRSWLHRHYQKRPPVGIVFVRSLKRVQHGNRVFEIVP